MRRSAPRPLRVALQAFAQSSAPVGLLSRVQAAWPEVAGPTIAAEAQPVSARESSVTVACESAVWAQELELLGDQLLAGLNERIGAGSVRGLRFVVRSL